MKIIDATPEDMYEIRKLRCETWLATYPNKEYGISEKDIRESFEFDSKEAEEAYYLKRKDQVKNDKKLHTWIAKDDGKIIGFCVASVVGYPKIIALYVLPKYQGKGVGSGLMRKALGWLGNKTIKLEVVTYNKNAIRFYEKFRFIKGKSSMSEVAKLPSGKVLPEIEMKREKSN